MKKPTKAELRELHEAEEAAKVAAFRKELPMHLLRLMSEVGNFGTTKVTPHGSGENLRVEFHFYDEPDKDVVLDLESHEWSLCAVRDALKRMRDARFAHQRKLELAQQTWDNMTPEQRSALNLERRPS